MESGCGCMRPRSYCIVFLHAFSFVTDGYLSKTLPVEMQTDRHRRVWVGQTDKGCILLLFLLDRQNMSDASRDQPKIIHCN